jgi:hypothetical protein
VSDFAFLGAVSALIVAVLTAVFAFLLKWRNGKQAVPPPRADLPSIGDLVTHREYKAQNVEVNRRLRRIEEKLDALQEVALRLVAKSEET